jgi:hypothetical protein
MFSSALVLLAASMVIGQAGEDPKPGPDYEQLKAMEWMIGDWEADYVVASPGLGLDGFKPGARAHSTNSYYWMENKNYIGLKFRDEIDGKVAHEGFEMIGVDPQSRKTVHWLFSILGGWGPGEWTVEGKTWKLKWAGTTGDGTKYEGVSFLVPIDANTHTWEMKECKKNGKPTPDTPIVTYRRVVRAEETSTPEDFRQLAELCVGRWAGKIKFIADWPGQKLGRGAEVLAYRDCEWTVDKKAIRISSTAGTSTSHEIMALDPVSKKIRLISVDTSGSFLELELWKKSDHVYGWRVAGGGTVDGRAFGGVGEWVFTGQEKTIKGKVTLGGKDIDPLNDVYSRLGAQ